MSRLSFLQSTYSRNHNQGLVCPLACGAAITLGAVFMLCPDLAIAATNASQGVVAGEAELNSALSNIKSLISGVVGKIVTIVALGFGLAGLIFKFNPVAIAGSFGVALTAAFGPSAVMAVVGATF